MGFQISKNIEQIKITTKLLEETQIVRNDLGKYYTYAFFFSDIVIDLITFNNMMNYMKNAMIYKSKN